MVTQRRVFVVMPFNPEFEDLWLLGIKEPLKSLGCLCTRADGIDSPGFVVSQIYKEIATADLVIAEMSGQNPNVFYEVGWAHALNKPTILFASKREDISVFDTQGYRHFQHDGKAHKLKETLLRIVPDILGNTQLPLPPAAELLWEWPSDSYEPPSLAWDAKPERCGGKPQLDRYGGQSIGSHTSGIPELSVTNTIVNWNHVPEWAIATLMKRSREFSLGDEVFFRFTARASGEATLEFSGDGTRHNENQAKIWAPGFTMSRSKLNSPFWETALLRSEVKPTEDGQDPSASGVSVYVRFRTADVLRIKHIALYRRAKRN